MFQLIVAVISIALVAALAIASIFYGGDAFTKSSEKAVVTTLINQGQQIAGAVALYKTDAGVNPADINALTPAYLADLPQGAKVTGDNAWAIDTDAGVATITFGDDVSASQAADLCAEVERQGAGGCYAAAGSAGGYFSFAL